MPKKKQSETKFKLNKDGYYRTTFTVIDVNGQKKRIPLRDKDPVQLEIKLREKKFEYERGLLVVNSKSTVEKWALEWLKTYKKDKVGLGTYEDYKQKVNNNIVPAIGFLPISEIKQYQLQNILNMQTGSKSNAKKVKNTIEQIFRTAAINGLINRNPAIGLKLPKLTDGKRRSITEEERTVILKVASYHRAGLWIKIMLYCGLRPSEAIVLERTDIDIKNKFISVTKALEIKTGKIKSTKSDAGERKTPIPDVLLNDLKRLNCIGLIFTQPTTGKQHTGESMRCMWESFKRSMNIEMGAKVYRNQIKKEDEKVATDLTPYCLRHTYGTDLQNAGVPINVAKYLMGHEDITVTANIYTHQTEETSLKALESMNNYYKAM